MRQVKIASVVAAVLLAVVSLGVSRKLIRDLQAEELAKMDVWVEAMRSLVVADENTDMNLVLKVINGNNNIPLIVTDNEGNVTTYRNVKLPRVMLEGSEGEINASMADSINSLREQSRRFMASGEHVAVPILMTTDIAGKTEADTLHVYYTESLMLKRLAYFPYVQLGVVALFVIVAFFALTSSKRAEQNKVWVGLSKETAHQLGTPISSLMAWSEVLAELYPNEEMIAEMKKDVQRLELIAERFSKIGSVPELRESEVCPVVEHVVDYIRRRTSDHVTMNCHFPANSSMSMIMCAPLIEWVLEVLCKNAIDAMAGVGTIDVTVLGEGPCCVIEVRDTGKGISRKNFKTVFSPGYTTKQRGWGLGLSLAKRIVEEYHHGRIYVKASELGVGSTFRIELPWR